MSLLELLVLLIIAGIAGVIAESLVGFTPGGFLVSVIIGVIGAFLGTWLAHRLGLPAILPIRVGSQTIEIVWAVLGSVVLVAVLSLLRGPRRVGRSRYWRRRSYR
ncbi:MAG: GlsB/YeaQ/YmgE family stress response membrane protein [Kouleothrix sp.]|nr:GlsB/YeaQ/YmgE family stress response membrane protein [Kouleothrix sp.]